MTLYLMFLSKLLSEPYEDLSGLPIQIFQTSYGKDKLKRYAYNVHIILVNKFNGHPFNHIDDWYIKKHKGYLINALLKKRLQYEKPLVEIGRAHV